MTDNAIRHLIAALGTLATIIVYVIAYYSGVQGWWFTIVTLIGVYAMIFKLVDV